ncbi:MAG: glycoside hydrolase family 125 protein [Bacilli bacterium]
MMINEQKACNNVINLKFFVAIGLLFTILLVSCDPSDTSSSGDISATTETGSPTESNTSTEPDPSEYQISNGGFETGDLTYWDVLEGEAFSNEGISGDEMVNDSISYGKQGAYFFKGREIEGRDGYEGRVRSETFLVGGAGYMTFYLGGGLNPGLTYLSLFDSASHLEVKRYANHLFNDPDFNAQGGDYYVENLVPYYADITDLLGASLYVVLVDQSTDNYGYLSVDGIVTYYEAIPNLEGTNSAIDILPDFEGQGLITGDLPNQDFASGTLQNWTIIGEDGVFQNSHINSSKRLSNRPNESKVGVLRSSAFKVEGVNMIRFRLGATKYRQVTYMSVKKVGTNEEVFRTYSDRWKDSDEENTHLYYVDVANYVGENLYLEFVDNSRGDWGLVTVEQIDTKLETLPTVNDEIAYDIRIGVSQSPAFQDMRDIMSPKIASITDSNERTIFEKNFLATIDGIVNNKGSWPSVLHYNKNGTTYVTTGDIDAMWLRDSSAQVLPYLRFMNDDYEVKMMVRGILLKQLEYIRRDPYANAFKNDGSVFERKFEIDSLIYPFWLADKYFEITGDDSIFDAFFLMSLRRAVTTLQNERNHNDANYSITHQGDLDNSSPAFNAASGLIWSGYRPSDDVTYYKFFIPGNMFAVGIMEKMNDLLTNLGLDSILAAQTQTLADEVRTAIETYGVYNHPTYGKMYAFEVNGMTSDAHSSSGKLLMDAANIPSLIAAPWLNYCDIDDETYQNTRDFALSDDNPYYYVGTYASGIGDPHDSISGLPNPHKEYPVVWPMSIAMQGLTSNDEAEIDTCLDYLMDLTGGTYVMHEAVNANDPSEYSRDYFTWPCALFAELYMQRHFYQVT